MEICSIRAEADYEAALAEIERLFDAAPNTPESDRLDSLTTLVEAYEMRHYPIPAEVLVRPYAVAEDKATCRTS
jgi:HTH-type transcriptional regulator/antitoxin HigA